MRIIIVELDAALGMFLKKVLAGEGHDVNWTDSATEALRLAQGTPPDLVVLHVAGQDEVELLMTFHRLHARTVVLALAARNTVEDRVRCLDLGADDCMTKPFSFHELTARCRALLRRQTGRSDGEVVLAHGDLHLNRITRSTSLAGRSLSLTTKEFRLLEHLLQNAGRCCSRGELLQEVFQLSPKNATNVVDVYINYLRKKLSFAEGTFRIVTVRGSGYCLAPAEQAGPGSPMPEAAVQYATM